MLDLFISLNEEEEIILFFLGALKNPLINNKTSEISKPLPSRYNQPLLPVSYS